MKNKEIAKIKELWLIGAITTVDALQQIAAIKNDNFIYIPQNSNFKDVLINSLN